MSVDEAVHGVITHGRSMAPLISVIIPAYNAARFVVRAVDSVLEQTYSHREVLVIDDGSGDGTADLLMNYGAAVRVVRQKNAGAGAARNRGIREARGEWVAFLDADDWWLPAKLKQQAAVLIQQPGVGFCSTRARVETPEGKHIGYWRCPENADTPLHALFLNNGAIAGSASGVMARRALVEKVGLFDENLRQEDTDLWFRLAAITDYVCLDEPLTVIVKEPGSRSGSLDAMRGAALQILRRYRKLLPPQDRGAFWQAAYAGSLADYAKWEYREGHRSQAIMHLLEGLARAPRRRGRMIVGLLLAMARGQDI